MRLTLTGLVHRKAGKSLMVPRHLVDVRLKGVRSRSEFLLWILIGISAKPQCKKNKAWWVQTASWPHRLQNWERDAICSQGFSISCQLIYLFCSGFISVQFARSKKLVRKRFEVWSQDLLYLQLICSSYISTPTTRSKALYLPIFNRIIVYLFKCGTWRSTSTRPELLITPLPVD